MKAARSGLMHMKVSDFHKGQRRLDQKGAAKLRVRLHPCSRRRRYGGVYRGQESLATTVRSKPRQMSWQKPPQGQPALPRRYRGWSAAIADQRRLSSIVAQLLASGAGGNDHALLRRQTPSRQPRVHHSDVPEVQTAQVRSGHSRTPHAAERRYSPNVKGRSDKTTEKGPVMNSTRLTMGTVLSRLCRSSVQGDGKLHHRGIGSAR